MQLKVNNFLYGTRCVCARADWINYMIHISRTGECISTEHTTLMKGEAKFIYLYFVSNLNLQTFREFRNMHCTQNQTNGYKCITRIYYNVRLLFEI